MENNNTVYIILLIFGIVDTILVLVPLLMTVSRNKKLREYTQTAEAEVIDMSLGRAGLHYDVGNHTRAWYPTFRYSVNGQVITHQSNVGTTEKIYNVGETFKILVDPNNYNKFVIPESKAYKLAITILWILAGFFVVSTAIATVLLFNLK